MARLAVTPSSSLNHFQPRWIPVKSTVGRLDITLLLTSEELSSQEGLPDFENEKYVVSYLLFGQSLASSLHCPGVSATGNELKSLTLVGPICLLPQKHYLKKHVKENFCIFSPVFFFFNFC